MTALFSIDCHACGAKNTIDRETLRRVEPATPSVEAGRIWVSGKEYTIDSDPLDAA